MPRKLTAKTPVGTFTRKTDRTYTHIVVIGPETEAQFKAALERDLSLTKANHEYHVAVESGTHPQWVLETVDGVTYQVHRDDLQKPASSRFFQKWERETLEEAVAECHRRDAERRAVAATGKWNLAGWCGRPDLAQKLADTTANRAWNVGREVRIYPVEG